VRIDEIRKVKVSPGAKATKAGAAKARAAVGPNRRFIPPLVADLVIVASETTQSSDTETESR
jgi:hypothetical protein